MAAGSTAAHLAVLVKFDGTPVSMPAEPCSLISGKYYRITAASKRCIDPRANLEVRDNGVAVVAANIEHVDYLHGIVKFAAAYTVTGPVTIQTGTYIPFTTHAFAKSFDLKVMRTMLDRTVFGNAFRRYLSGLGDFDANVGSFDVTAATGVETLEASRASGTPRVMSVEIIQDGVTLANGGIVWRGLVLVAGQDDSAEPDGLVEGNIPLTGAPMMSTNALVTGSWPVSWSLLDGASGLYV